MTAEISFRRRCAYTVKTSSAFTISVARLRILFMRCTHSFWFSALSSLVKFSRSAICFTSRKTNPLPTRQYRGKGAVRLACLSANSCVRYCDYFCIRKELNDSVLKSFSSLFLNNLKMLSFCCREAFLQVENPVFMRGYSVSDNYSHS